MKLISSSTRLILFLIIALSIAQVACNKNPNNNASVLTMAVTNITATSALSGGNAVDDGGEIVIEKGVCWSTSPNPSIANDRTSDGLDTGLFISNISNLSSGTTYFVKAYATNALGTFYGNEFSFVTANAPAYTIGQTHEGGIIFYLDGSGEHGLIAAPNDLGPVDWGCEGTLVSGTSTLLGTGMNNTNAIVGQCSNTNMAARLCYDLSVNNKSDWYLPSKDELQLLHQNLYLQGMGNLQQATYWSSSEYNAQFAWKQFFNFNNNQGYYDKDLIPYFVRPIRSF